VDDVGPEDPDFLGDQALETTVQEEADLERQARIGVAQVGFGDRSPSARDRPNPHACDRRLRSRPEAAENDVRLRAESVQEMQQTPRIAAVGRTRMTG
jgi:hypothetical protein